MREPLGVPYSVWLSSVSHTLFLFNNTDRGIMMPANDNEVVAELTKAILEKLEEVKKDLIKIFRRLKC